ncbi:MAG: Asp-tRNA(Asn)/Glu-tRNA(Gln) amidotransferase subunit GatC [Rickettsiaceae bacterium]|nr:Asp-tRNA(Asn)/Glu-tRNA(Gln) amidotransferase subunit GatC [Rickettsiaceae bacterium]
MSTKFSVSSEEVQKIAKLARIKLKDQEEVLYYQEQLSYILHMIEKIEQVDCSGIEPIYSLAAPLNRMREDIVNLENNIEDIFVNSPRFPNSLSREIKFFIVPKMVE